MTGREKLLKTLIEDGYSETFRSGPWVYVQKSEVFFCLHETHGYERRTIVNGGRSPSVVEYFEYEEE